MQKQRGTGRGRPIEKVIFTFDIEKISITKNKTLSKFEGKHFSHEEITYKIIGVEETEDKKLETVCINTRTNKSHIFSFQDFYHLEKYIILHENKQSERTII